MKNKHTLFIAQAAMIAAIYVALTYIFVPFSFREIQVRIAEALTILPVFAAIMQPPLCSWQDPSGSLPDMCRATGSRKRSFLPLR